MYYTDYGIDYDTGIRTIETSFFQIRVHAQVQTTRFTLTDVKFLKYTKAVVYIFLWYHFNTCNIYTKKKHA